MTNYIKFAILISQFVLSPSREAAMKHLMKYFLMIIACIIPMTISAYEMTDNEFINNIGVEQKISDSVGIRGSYTHFYVPKISNHIHFIYLGPTFSIADFLWISPQAGFAGNWTANKDAFYASLWLNLNLLDGRLTVFNEADAVFYSGDLQDYYGFTSVDYHYQDYCFGLQYEQVNMDFKAGPHAGFAKGPMSVQFQVYMINNDLNAWNIRVVTGLNF